MIKKNSNAFFEAEKFAKRLSELIDSLPSESGRQQLASQLETLIQFLSVLKSHLAIIPTQEETIAARTAVDTLNSLFAQAKSNPLLGAALGIKATAPRKKPPAITSEEIERANTAISQFSSLPSDRLRSALDGMSVRDLQAAASAMGMQTTQSMARDVLVQRVATEITNTRGYRSLRDGTK